MLECLSFSRQASKLSITAPGKTMKEIEDYQFTPEEEQIIETVQEVIVKALVEPPAPTSGASPRLRAGATKDEKETQA